MQSPILVAFRLAFNVTMPLDAVKTELKFIYAKGAMFWAVLGVPRKMVNGRCFE